MALKKFTKQPADVLDYDVDYSDWVVSPDDIDSATVDAETGLTVDSFVVSENVVKVWLSGGTDGAVYKVTVVATAQSGRVKEKDFLMIVQDD